MPRREQDIAIVLAAGAGRRMGGPKALMEVAGRPWWRWQLERLADAGIGSVWVVSDEVAEGISSGGGGVECVASDPQRTMFESLMAGVRAIETRGVRGVFALPVDVPAPGPAVWSALSREGGAAAPVHDGVAGHPLYLAWVAVESLLLDDQDEPERERRLDRIVGPEIRHVRVEDPAVATNLNTPADVARWMSGRESA